MRRITTTALVASASIIVVAAQHPIQVGGLRLAESSRVAEIDTDNGKWQPSRLAWSADAREIYVQMMRGQFPKAEKLTHLVFGLESGKRTETQAEPTWATAYWTAKSGQVSPDAPTFKIDLKSEVRNEKTVSAPMGGQLARGGGVGADGGTTTSSDALSAAYNQQSVPVNTMILHGQIVGEYVNSVIVPGQTFGWGPKGSKVIAYSAHKTGRIVLMDESGTRQEFESTKDSLFPAWSPDGTRLAWLQKDGRKKYILQVARVSRN